VERYQQADREAKAVETLREMAVSWFHQIPRVDVSPKPVEKVFHATYASQYDGDGNFNPKAASRIPAWLHDWLGPRFLDSVVTLEIDTTYRYDMGDAYGDDIEPLETKFFELISNFRNLRSLKLATDLTAIEDFSALEKLSRLESLEVIGVAPFPFSSINDISTLKELNVRGEFKPSDEPISFQLKSLALRPAGLINLPKKARDAVNLCDFGNLSQLESLRIGSLESLDSQSGLHSLKTLRLATGNLQHLEGLADSPLETIILYDCRSLKDVSALHGSETLKQLAILRYENLDFLATEALNPAFPNLEELVLKTYDSEFALADFSHHLPKLKKLIISGGTTDSLDSLAELPDLRELILEAPRIERIDVPLNQLESFICVIFKTRHLNFLTTKDNRLRRFSLWDHSLNDPGIGNLNCLKFANQLERLDIAGTDIQSVDFLNEITGLKRVELSSNEQLLSIEGLAGSAQTLERARLARNMSLLDSDLMKQLTIIGDSSGERLWEHIFSIKFSDFSFQDAFKH